MSARVFSLRVLWLEPKLLAKRIAQQKTTFPKVPCSRGPRDHALANEMREPVHNVRSMLYTGRRELLPSGSLLGKSSSLPEERGTAEKFNKYLL